MNSGTGWMRFPEIKKIALICNTGVRSYEAQITLTQMGIEDTYSLKGGMSAMRKRGFEL